jgi:predicted acylesterase/phospholipase RssA
MPSIPPADRYCDLVMKGGITSGVVYPPAIFKLAHEYRLKNIGGTSAGAIAAAIAAAAEFRRRRESSMKGFDLIGRLPTMLKEEVRGKSRLLRLFQADRPCRRLFRILIGSLNASGTFHRIGAVLFGCVTSYWMGTLASILVTVGIGYGYDSIHAGIWLFLITLPTFIGLLIYIDITRNVVGNNYGLCKGMTTTEKYGDALTPWLHQLIQEAAGLPLDKPLTFGDLWKAPGGPQPPPGSVTQPRSIDLEMFTTNLSHGRPYIFPHIEPTARLFYDPEELKPYLPAEVMKWFNERARPYARNTFSPMSDPDPALARQLNLLELPRAEHFPVLLAARMSLSFPILFAAVPLWAIDYDLPRERRTFCRCLFSDGGISSNFPMHLFDGLVPQWPTFGIDLEPEIKNLPGRTFLPERYLQGIADRWTRFDQDKKAASRMGGFLMGIANAMQNWNDNTQSRLAGVRDRVVRVRLEKNEGGMNLDMPAGVIEDVEKRGGEAADKLIARFLGSAPAHVWTGWASQRWVRLDVFIYALNQKIAALRHALGGGVPESEPFEALIGRARVTAPPGHDKALTEAQAEALKGLIRALDEAAKQFERSSPHYPSDPVPEPELRARSPL